ncbi:MAG: polyprenyl synthetase family protein [Elusimicrobiota bacterium]
MRTGLAAYIFERALMVERELRRLLERRGPAAISFLAPVPAPLRKAMRYSLLAGGKRLRPILTMAAAECCGLSGLKALRAGCALEMIHTYSLIHDDLPAMDDDDLRRGRPTSHKVFGEAMAILAGDGLLTLAFELAAENASGLRLPGKATAELIRVIAEGAGWRGMVGGQVADLSAQGAPFANGRKARAAKLLEYVHIHKTSALITASLEAGAVLAQASSAQRRALREYGRGLGLAFQIADDVLDRVGDKKKLGKRGSDLDNQKLTYPELYGVEGARERARRTAEAARSRLKAFGGSAWPLRELASYVVERDR